MQHKLKNLKIKPPRNTGNLYTNITKILAKINQSKVNFDRLYYYYSEISSNSTKVAFTTTAIIIIIIIIIIITMSRPHYCQSSTVLDCINAYSRERAWEALHWTILGRERRVGPTTYEPRYRSRNSGTHPPLFFPWNIHQLKHNYFNCLKHLPCSKMSNKYE